MAGRTRLVKSSVGLLPSIQRVGTAHLTWSGPEHATTPQPGRCPKWA
jgi:hypothetical protein